jgi:hypothetical protein
MERKTPLVALVWKISGMALFGLLAIVLAGPVLAILAVVLSFAVVGFVFWLPIHVLLRRYHPRWRAGTDKVGDCAQRAADLVGVAWCGGVRLAREAHATLRGTASVVGPILLETLSGAVVGVLLVSTCWPQNSLAVTVPVAAVVGMILGIFVVLSRPRLATEDAEQVPEGGQ